MLSLNRLLHKKNTSLSITGVSETLIFISTLRLVWGFYLIQVRLKSSHDSQHSQ